MPSRRPRRSLAHPTANTGLTPKAHRIFGNTPLVRVPGVCNILADTFFFDDHPLGIVAEELLRIQETHKNRTTARNRSIAKLFAQNDTVETCLHEWNAKIKTRDDHLTVYDVPVGTVVVGEFKKLSP